ncbi:MAG: GIY-YIG nuclease family protein, partial [Microgenomates group bacterium]
RVRVSPGSLVYYVYILQSLKNNNLYMGFSSNLKNSLENHNLGLNHSTKNRRPLKLIYYEAFLNEEDAKNKEKFYKSGRGHEVIKKMLSSYFKSSPTGRPFESEGF